MLRRPRCGSITIGRKKLRTTMSLKVVGNKRCSELRQNYAFSGHHAWKTAIAMQQVVSMNEGHIARNSPH